MNGPNPPRQIAPPPQPSYILPMSLDSLLVSFPLVRVFRALLVSTVSIYEQWQSDIGCCFDDADFMMFPLRYSDATVDIIHNVSMIMAAHTERGNDDVWHGGEKPHPDLPDKPSDLDFTDWCVAARFVTDILKDKHPDKWLNI